MLSTDLQELERACQHEGWRGEPLQRWMDAMIRTQPLSSLYLRAFQHRNIPVYDSLLTRLESAGALLDRRRDPAQWVKEALSILGKRGVISLLRYESERCTALAQECENLKEGSGEFPWLRVVVSPRSGSRGSWKVQDTLYRWEIVFWKLPPYSERKFPLGDYGFRTVAGGPRPGGAVFGPSMYDPGIAWNRFRRFLHNRGLLNDVLQAWAMNPIAQDMETALGKKKS